MNTLGKEFKETIMETIKMDSSETVNAGVNAGVNVGVNEQIDGKESIVIKKGKKERSEIPTKLLRGLGVFVIILASAIYLFQGSNGIDPIQRHWIFIGITALFGGLTWFLGGALKEMKGARTFISLAVASIPVLFTQLGSMIHALVVGKSAEMSTMLDFSLITVGNFTIIALLTSFISIPIILFGNRILARNQQKALTLFMILGNVLLLFPVRSLIPVSSILIVAVIVLLRYIMKTYNSDSTVSNTEGTISLVTLFLPIVIIGLRTVSIYGQGPVFTGLLCILSGVVAVVLPMNRKRVLLGSFVQITGIVSVIVGWIMAIGGWVLDISELHYYLLAIPVGGIVYALSFTLKTKPALLVRRVAVIIIAGFLGMGQVIFHASAITVMMTLVGGVMFIVAASYTKEKIPFYLGIASMIWGVLGLMVLITTALSGNTWLILMLGGILIIVGGSLIEVFNRKWKTQAVQFKEELTAWN